MDGEAFEMATGSVSSIRTNNLKRNLEPRNQKKAETQKCSNDEHPSTSEQMDICVFILEMTTLKMKDEKHLKELHRYLKIHYCSLLADLL